MGVAARIATSNFRSLITVAVLFGLAVPPVGIAASADFNLPTGPSIVLAHIAILALCQFLQLIKTRRPAF